MFKLASVVRSVLCGPAQLDCHEGCEVTKPWDNRISLEREVIDGDNPVSEIHKVFIGWIHKYYGAREIPWESVTTT